MLRKTDRSMLSVGQQCVLELLRSALDMQRSAIAMLKSKGAGVVAETFQRCGIPLTVFPELKALPEECHALRRKHAIVVAQNRTIGELSRGTG